jgi:hypothetical protein
MKLAGLLSDLPLVAGAGCISLGVWYIDPNVGLIVGGALLLLYGLVRGRAQAFAEYMARKGGK